MYSSGINSARHQAVERINLSNEMAPTQATDGGIARHDPDGVKFVGQESRARTQARTSGCSFYTCMAAANNNDIIMNHAAFLSSETASVNAL